MKTATETQIAKENVGDFNNTGFGITMKMVCKEHLTSCQRFLEFLEQRGVFYNEEWKKEFEILNDKITDLQNAIKIYKDAGIK